MNGYIPVVDLFAGPGGLGEGFSNCKLNSPFKIVISVEYEKNAHNTLTLRAFYRKLTSQERNKYYYPYIQSSNEDIKKLRRKVMLESCAQKWDEAKSETLYKPHSLGNPEKWMKIRNNVPLTDFDSKPTNDELNILERIDSIKSQTTGPLIVIGGPPCQAYSVNGRNRIRSKKDYSPENDERFFLYQEYLKVLDRADPDAFVMENVEGILSARLATGELIFEKIKQELVRSERIRGEQYDIYSLACEPDEPANDMHGPIYFDNSKYVINASRYGVPQSRKRVILLGIKHKYGPIEDFLKPDQISAPTASALLSGLPILRSGLSKKSNELDDNLHNWQSIWKENKKKLISILLDASEMENVASRGQRHKSNLHQTLELADLTKMRLDEIRTAYFRTAKELQKLNLPSHLTKHNGGRGNDLFCKGADDTESFSKDFKHDYPDLYRWLKKDIKGAANHATREHMSSDLLRYMFSAAWTKAHSFMKSPFPKSKDFPFSLSPDHKNWESGDQADRFRTIGEEMLPLTITSHLRKDGHAQIHYDPTQNRSLTVREAARIQTFPDDYYFEGPRGWQYQQVGNAVPAFLAKQIANHLIVILEKKSLI